MINIKWIQAAVFPCFLMFFISAVVPAQAAGMVETYKDYQHQFLVDLPAGWSAYEQMKAITGKSSPNGMVIFSKEDISKMEIQDQLKTMANADTGAIPSFFVDRLPKKNKMSCKSFGKKEAKSVLKLIKKDKMFSRDRKIIAPLETSFISFGGCEGIRIKGETEKQDGTRWVIDIHAASDGKILYLFTLRNIKNNYEKNLGIYEEAMSTVKLTSTE